jgi:alanine racemase
MAVIKANAYGHGLEAAAGALAGADGVRHRILLLEGALNAEQLAVAARERVDLMVHSFEQLRMLEERAGGETINAWIKIDTGMNRLGFRVEDFAAAHSRLKRIRGVAPDPTLATHLASADELENPQTQAQLDAFATVTSGLRGEKSIANSAAILAWPAARGDWVRPGLMLYGASPFTEGSGENLGLRAVMALRTGVITVRAVRAGESVGYGGAWRAERDTRVAVLAAGYGDGYPRSARTGTPVLVNGRRAGLVGRVSMDMITVDVTDQPEVSAGDPVELWGQELPIEEIARCADTIPYVLSCGVSPRVPHVAR